MRKAFVRSSLLAAVLLAGCVSANPEAQHVRITTNQEVVRGCEFIGNVRAFSGWTGGMGQNNVEETLKERAHKIGADTVFIATSNYDSGFWATHSSATAEAYRCKR